MVNAEKTKFHGETYEPEIDRERLKGQLQRVWDILSDGKMRSSAELCTAASTSFAALRNRISDLRVYHGAVIEAKRLQDGLWGYQFQRMMTPQEYEAFKEKLAAKRGGDDAAAQYVATLLDRLRKIHRIASNGVKADLAYLIYETELKAEAEGWQI